MSSNFQYNAYKEQVELSKGQINKLQERVRELERANKQLKGNLSVYKGYYKNILKINEDVIEQNKRYREALEFYADERNYEERDFGVIKQNAIQEGDKGNTARKALDGYE